MKPPRLLIRRLVVDPLWIPLAVALGAVLLAAGAASVIVAPLARRRRAGRLALAAALYLLVDAGLLICSFGLWLRRPLPGQRRGERWIDAHATLLRRALALLVAAARPLLGFRVDVEELPAPASLAGSPVLVLARHGGPGDSFAIAELLLSHLQRRPVIVLKQVLRWDPGLDVVLSRMPSCFLPPRGGGHDLPASIAAAARSAGGRDAILLFPEGGNWTPKRYRNALARLWVRGRRTAAARAAANPHVLPPHPAGVLACLQARPDLEVVLVAHTGLENLVSVGDIWRALPLTERPMVTRWWHLPRAGLPDDPALQQDWLDMQWAIVDSWIDARKALSGRGRDAGEPGSPNAAAAAPAAAAVSPAAVAPAAADSAAAADAAGQG